MLYPYPALAYYLDELFELCKKHKVERLYAFGSVVSGHFDPETSDIDLIVELEKMSPLKHGEILLKLWDELEDLFHRKVDLLTIQSIKNPFLKKNIELTKKLIYDRKSQEISV